MGKTQIQQCILARDLLDLAIDNWNSVDIIERTSDYFFSLAMIITEFDAATPVQWHNLYSLLDEHYGSLRVDPTSIDTEILTKLKTSQVYLQQQIKPE